MSSNSPSGGMKEMVRSFSKRDSRTHWWNFTSSSSTDLLFPPMWGRGEVGMWLRVPVQSSYCQDHLGRPEPTPYPEDTSFVCTRGQFLDNCHPPVSTSQPNTGMESWGLGSLCHVKSSADSSWSGHIC